jgi:hypothetical protein
MKDLILRIREFLRPFTERFLRYSRRLTDIFPAAIYLYRILTMAGASIAYVVLQLPGPESFISSITGGDENLNAFLNNYLCFFGIWVIFLLVMLIYKPNRPMFRMLLPNKNGNNLKGFLAGTLLGFCSNGFCILMSVILGDIKLYYYGIDPVIIIAFMIAVFIQSGAEELGGRLYLYSKLRRRYKHAAVAIFVNAAVFGFMHKGNPGFTLLSGFQIFFCGLIFTLLVYYYDSLWAAMSFHATWNFTQNLIFGLPNSGIVSSYSIFKLDAASAENGLFYDVNFGVEGSIGGTLLLFALCVTIFLINRNKGEKNDIWAPYDVPRNRTATSADSPAEPATDSYDITE